MEITPIAYIHTPFPTKFGIPKQSGLISSLSATIVFVEPFAIAEAIRGLEKFSHLWLIWEFSAVPANKPWTPTVRPPRLGGNVHMGVFATRSPFRPNRLGLSSVQLEKIEFVNGKPILYVRGADLLDGTPIYDIKPYLTTTDCHPQAQDGFVTTHTNDKLHVIQLQQQYSNISTLELEQIKAIISEDPRPAYHHDTERKY